MEKSKKYKPLVDKLFLIIFLPTAALVLGGSVALGVFETSTLLYTVPVSLFVLYFLVSPLFGYAELRESSLFIKYGVFLKKEIPYSKVRGVEKDRKFYSESMMSLKNSFEHVNIKYNTFDITSVSVKDNDAFVSELLKIIENYKK